MQSNGSTLMEPNIRWGETRRLEIRYSGNLHGDVEQLPRLATVVKREKEAFPDLLLVDTGNFSRGSHLNDSFQGRPSADVLGHLGYHAVGVGEDEVSWGLRGLIALTEVLKCPLLAANWRFPEREQLELTGRFASFVRVERQGMSVVVAGLGPLKAPPGVEVVPAHEAVQSVLDEVGPDGAVILISQLGYGEDRQLAARFDGLQVILEGVVYEGFTEVSQVKQTLIVPATAGAGSLGSLGLDLTGTLVIESQGEG